MLPLNTMLSILFENHEVDNFPKGRWLHFPDTPHWACASLGQELPDAGEMTVQLDVRFEVAPGRYLIESCAGIGESREEAVEEAFRNFASYSMHVLIKAFLRPEYDEVLQETWTIGGRERPVTIGYAVLRGRPPGEDEEILSWYETLEQRIRSLDLGPESHWVRIYYAQAENETLACEVLLDNLPWPEMQAELAAYAWPPGQGFYSVRQLLIVEGEEGQEITPESAVLRLFETLAANPNLTQHEAYETLTDADVPPPLADRTYKFTQVALGRALLADMGIAFSTDYLCFDAEGEVRESGQLAEEPSFAAASRLSSRYLPLPACQSLALASADVQAVNNALNAGSRPEELVMAPVCNFLEAPTAAGMQKVQHLLRQRLAALTEPRGGASSPPPTPQKNTPRWQFWKR